MATFRLSFSFFAILAHFRTSTDKPLASLREYANGLDPKKGSVLFQKKLIGNLERKRDMKMICYQYTI
ncbi:hypothetical protein LH53_08380 [Mesotoga sp. TolDC]|nr:hypothetical protein LH53_08380 [Mesotoga sp. TolDC]